jgi:hypothetical protein
MTLWCSVNARRLLLIAALLVAAPAAHGKPPRRPPPPRRPAPPPVQVQPAPERKPEGEPPRPRPEEERELRRGERVEFDGRLIEGQTAAAGAIYLFERLPSELRSMIMERQSYRREVLQTLYPNGAPPEAQRAGEKAGGR